MALPWRRDKTDLRTQVAEYIYSDLRGEKADKSVIQRVKEYNKSRADPLTIKIVIYVPVWIPEGKQKGHWIECRDRLMKAFLDENEYGATGLTLKKAAGYYKMDDDLVFDQHAVVEAMLSSEILEEVADWLRDDIETLQRDMVQDSIWLIINDCPRFEGYSPASKRRKRGWKIGVGSHDTYPSDIHENSTPAEEPVTIQNINNIDQITNIGTQNITNIYASEEKSAPELKTPADFYNKGLELFEFDKPEKAYNHFSEAWKRSLNDSEPHLIEVCKRSAQQALMCLKGRPDLADDDEIEQLKKTVIRLERDIEIPNFAGLDELVQSFSDFTNLLHHPRHVGYIEFICERIEALETIILNPKSAALSRQKIRVFRGDLNRDLEIFPAHEEIFNFARDYFRTAKKVINLRWREYIESQPNLFPDGIRTGSDFSLSNLLDNPEFSKIKGSLRKNTSWQSKSNLDISRYVESRCKLFDVIESHEFRRLDNDSRTAEELKEDLKQALRTLSVDRNDCIHNLSEIIRFCSRTDTADLSDNNKLIAVVFERHGDDKKPWHLISRYEHFKNRIDSLAWGEYIESTSTAHSVEGNTLDLMKKWLLSDHKILEIEGIGGLGKTASVLEFIRRLGTFGENREYLSHDMFFLTAKSKEQGEMEVDSEARSRDHARRNPRNYDLGIGEYLKELKFDDVLLRINKLYDHDLNKNHSLNDEELQERVILNLKGKKALIFLDNFEDVSQEERKKYSGFFERLPMTCRVIITTRPGEGDIGVSYKMKLDNLSARASSELFERRYQKLHSKAENKIMSHLSQIREMKNKELNIIEQLIEMVPSKEEYKEKKEAIRQGSPHPLVIFYMVSMSLNNRPKRSGMGFLEHLLDLSLDPEKGFDKAQMDWQSWVITKSYSALGRHALQILETLAGFGGGADGEDIIATMGMDTADYTKGVAQLMMQEIFIEQSSDKRQLFMRKTARPFLRKQGITINLESRQTSANTTQNRVEGLESLLRNMRIHGVTDSVAFDSVNERLNLNLESRGGVDLTLLGNIVEVCSFIRESTYYAEWNKFLQASLGYYSEHIKSQGPENVGYIVELFVRAALSRIHDKELFTATLMEIHALNRPPELGENTRDKLQELIEKDEYDYIFDVESYGEIDHVQIWLAILDSIMLEISRKRDLQRKLILFLLQLHASPYRLDDLQEEIIKKILNVSRDSIEWDVQYDSLLSKYLKHDENHEDVIKNLDAIPRYTRYDPQKIKIEDLQSTNLVFRDTLNNKVLPDDFGSNIILSFDKRDHFTNTYIFRVVKIPNHTASSQPTNHGLVKNEPDEDESDTIDSLFPELEAELNALQSKAEQGLPSINAWKPISTTKSSEKINDDELVAYLTHPSNWNHNNQITKKVLESKFGKVPRDQIDGIINYINNTDDNGVHIEIVAKGDPYTERYGMSVSLEHDPTALEKFVREWFEDSKDGETNFYCRGMPFSVKTVGDLFNGYLPAIRDNVRKTNSQRGIDFANEHLKSLPGGGNIGPKTSFVWYCAFHTFRDFINVNDLAELRCKLIPQLAREQHRRLGREELKPTLVNILRARCREWEDELIRIHCSGGNSNPNRSSPSSVRSNSVQRHVPRRLTSQHALKKYDVYNKEDRQRLFDAAYAILQENDANYRIQKAWVSLETRKAIFQQRGILSIAEFLNRLANFDRLMKN
tara:strand:- start:1472 stop:6520 length:5049 start_codon:yes stop_codon:yes gene_type:complete